MSVPDQYRYHSSKLEDGLGIIKRALRKIAHAIYRDFLKLQKMKIFSRFFFYFSYFCSKHRLWVHVKTA